MYKCLILIILLNFTLWGSEEVCKLSEAVSETSHVITIQGKPLKYKATAGNLILKDCFNNDSASIFFVAYTKEDVAQVNKRPITFCFNGGPGSSSVWLHIGAFGPKVIQMDDENAIVAPYNLVDNPDSILDITDLVFIDPVSTGHSVAAPGVDPKSFHGLNEDAKSVAKFISQYLSRYNRWGSPKYIAGESYGTTRAGALSYILLDDHGIYLNGVILISSIMNFHTKNFDPGNDLAYPLFLPSYTAAAWYHKKLADNTIDLSDALAEAEEFALNQYAVALLKGDSLSKEERKNVTTRLSELTGLSEQYIDLADLRVNPMRFNKEILRAEKKVTGRFDSRTTGYELDGCSDRMYADPCNAIKGPFTSALQDYLANELKWTSDNQYKILANVYPWNWGKSNQVVNTSADLAKALSQNPSLKVFVASGYFDLATPYFATVYTFDHLGLHPDLRDRLFMYEYEGGHMMYLSKPVLSKLRKDLEYYYKAE